eukprot:SAG22_NODE_94_length_20824_cov_230.693718_11_plen_1262_part_00
MYFSASMIRMTSTPGLVTDAYSTHTSPRETHTAVCMYTRRRPRGAAPRPRRRARDGAAIAMAALHRHGHSALALLLLLLLLLAALRTTASDRGAAAAGSPTAAGSLPLAVGTEPPRARGRSPASDSPPAAGGGHQHAYYKLSRADLTNASWPRGFEHYHLFVANPGFTAGELAKVRSTVPGSKVLAYSDMSWAYVGTGCSEGNGNFSAYFHPRWAVTNLRTGRPVCPFGAAATPLDPSPKITPVAAAVLTKESADALVRYHTEVTLSAPYDGLYMDDFEYAFPAPWAANVVAFTNGSFDTDADGLPDSVASLQAQYDAWKPYYSAELRKVLGSRLLLANTGSPSASDTALDGQTIEFEWCAQSRGGLPACTYLCVAGLRGQHATSAAQGGGRTALSVMWLTDAKALPAETQCAELRALQKQMPWLLAGLDRSDLTWPSNASCTAPAAAAAAAHDAGPPWKSDDELAEAGHRPSADETETTVTTVAFDTPTKVGESNYTHFWMPASLFKGAGDDIILSIDLAGDGKPCPPPGHPQNCSALMRSQNSGKSWARVYGDVPGMALPIPQTGEPGKVRTYNFDAKPAAAAAAAAAVAGGGGFEIFSAMWLDTAAAGVQRVGAESIMVPLVGFPPMAGPPAASGNVVRLRHQPTQLIGTMYGRLANSSHACKPFEGKGGPPFPGCNSNFFIASSDEGRSWRYRSHIDWDSSMSTKAEGITESSVTELPDGRLLSIFRLQSDMPLYKALSTDEAHSWTRPERTPAWAVYPQLRTLPNGAVVLASGRPGLGLWLSFSAGERWEFHNLCAVHNRLYPDATLHYQQTELDVQNASSPGTWPMQTKAYVGMVVLGCEGKACSVLISYDRLANGNAGPPGPWGKVDAVFALKVTVTASGLSETSRAGSVPPAGDGSGAALKTDDDYPGSVVYDKPARAIPDVTNFSWSAMPLGNGNLSVSVWFEPPRHLVFYLGKSDSYDELHNLVKVGRVRVSFSGSPFSADGAGFRATLDLASATLNVAGAAGFAARLWVDANQPVLRIAASGLGSGAMAQVTSEIWRNNATGRTPATATDLCWADETLASVASDVVVPKAEAVAWYHRNGGTAGMLSHSSLWESELRLQGLGSLVDNPPPGMPPDPLTNATFGAVIIATTGTVAKHAPSDAKMTVQASTTGVMELALVSIKRQTATAAEFTTHLAEATRAVKVADARAARAQHEAWWSAYWDSSWVKVTAAAPSSAAAGSFNASLVTWQTAINRYLSACEGRGPGIIKFK